MNTLIIAGIVIIGVGFVLFRRMSGSEAEEPNVAGQTASPPQATADDATKLMALIEAVYQFGDPDYEPAVIYLEAESKLGFDDDYVDELVQQLVKQQIVQIEYRPGPDMHPGEAYDYWRLSKV